jgi:hypothetical protein
LKNICCVAELGAIFEFVKSVKDHSLQLVWGQPEPCRRMRHFFFRHPFPICGLAFLKVSTLILFWSYYQSPDIFHDQKGPFLRWIIHDNVYWLPGSLIKMKCVALD